MEVCHQTLPLIQRADLLEGAKLLLMPSLLPPDQPHQQLGTNSADGPLHRATTKSHVVRVRAKILWRNVHSLMR